MRGSSSGCRRDALPLMAIRDLLTDLRRDERFMTNVMAWRTLHAQDARYAPAPAGLHPLLRETLAARGIEQLYTHQAAAVAHALAGRNVAVVTPTASGKTLCYNLPVLHSLLTDPAARALYLFPTKALAQDQVAELDDFITRIEESRLKIGGKEDAEIMQAGAQSNLQSLTLTLAPTTYDGDTPTARRGRIRSKNRLILSNPDMLHVGILPYHTQWIEFLSGLRYVVIDEMHTYRGIFGSHVANVLRRLRRLCAHYGAQPQFICTSATIANPQELAQWLTETPVEVVANNGAPRGEKQIILYNPPIYDAEHGLRRAATLEAQELAARCVLAGVQTIVFARARQTTEVVLTYLRERLRGENQRLKIENWKKESDEQTQDDANLQSSIFNLQSSISGYRGGYLPAERRAIEAGLRSGTVRAVVATNALELGIDIGQLQAAVLCGYPGSIAGTWQQMGRAGRTRDAALALLVATSGPLDQYVIQHPEFLFERSPEHALINPDNLMLLLDHVRCAAFELPFRTGEAFGACAFISDALVLLVEEGELLPAGGRLLWNGAGYPARNVSLRSSGGDRVVIQSSDDRGPQIIGEVDGPRAIYQVHDGAIYIHQGESYYIERLDLDAGIAYARPINADFYTEAGSETEIDVLAVHEEETHHGALAAHGELLVTSQVVGFRRIKRFTHETVGVEPLEYPPQQLDTSGYWFSILPETQHALAEAGLWHDSVNDYGPNWQAVRAQVRARDGYRCTQCGAPEGSLRQHDVHHIMPFRTFGYVAGVNENYREANRLSNLTLLCRACHRRLEATVRVGSGLDGLAYVLANLAPLHLMCDRSDLSVTITHGAPARATDATPNQETSGQLPTLYIFERIAAGLGFSARLYELHDALLTAAAQRVAACPCPHGCPACVGPILEEQAARLDTKRLTLALLNALRGEAAGSRPMHDEVNFEIGR
ncbi:MAG: DEAD/DEAH box helicase [Caldilineaceae bacterium]|nr:DEAD/DEAH box helicase [Caldilineaceae bacterium]